MEHNIQKLSQPLLCRGPRMLMFTTVATLLVQDFRQQKNQPLLIYCSRPLRDSQEPKTRKNFQFSRWLFQKIPFLYISCTNPGFGRPWGMLLIFFLIGIFIMLQKNTFGQKKISNFMHRFKSAILEKLKNCQNGTFEPVHEI